jgi:acetyl-CoA C-acetyltransferase
VVKNRYYALYNPIAEYGCKLTLDDVASSEMVSYPLTRLDISEYSDGSTVIVMAEGDTAKEMVDEPIWIEGVGWISESSYLEEWDLAINISVRMAGDMAYKLAGITNPFKDIDYVEVDDRYSYRELQSLIGLDLIDGYDPNEFVYEGVSSIEGDLPTNLSGGYLGQGYPLEAGGLLRIYNAVNQLRGLAGKTQVDDCNRALVMTRREFPSPSVAVAILGR